MITSGVGIPGRDMAAFDEYREQLALLPLIEEAENRHLHIFAWLTRFALECGCDRPVLVGCSAVELYTDACTATGDVDLIVGDINKLSANLLKIGFQRSSDPRYLYHLGLSILLEFPASELRAGEETVTFRHDRVECRVISPVDLILDRLELFEATGGGVDLVHAYLIYHLHYERLDLERLQRMVKTRDVRESYRFIKLLHEEVSEKNLSIKSQADRLGQECLRRKGTHEGLV